MWYILGFIPTIIIGLLFLIWIHTKRAKLFYYNHDLNTGFLWYIEVFNNYDYSTIKINDVVHEKGYLKTIWLTIKTLVSMKLALVCIILSVAVVSILGPILYIPMIAMISTYWSITKRDYKNSNSKK